MQSWIRDLSQRFFSKWFFDIVHGTFQCTEKFFRAFFSLKAFVFKIFQAMEEKCFQAEESGYDPLLGLTGFHRPVRSRSLGQGRVAHTFKKSARKWFRGYSLFILQREGLKNEPE